ncbi:hypothetical protein B0H11DRAFT_1918707 [Mycena galericulata]|nr:hypothetical protein B0H11DRAFT_1918707 [Mycena galericulata]
MAPTWLAGLAPPPPTFIPCWIPDHLGPNFTNHVDFSGKGNKTYWVMYLGPGQGAYSLKATCVAALASNYSVDQAVEGFQRQDQMLLAWAKHCYHRHAKCRRHAEACHLSVCPAHPPPVVAAPPPAATSSPATGSIIRVPRVKIEDPVGKRDASAKTNLMKVEGGGVKREAERDQPLRSGKVESPPVKLEFPQRTVKLAVATGSRASSSNVQSSPRRGPVTPSPGTPLTPATSPVGRGVTRLATAAPPTPPTPVSTRAGRALANPHHAPPPGYTPVPEMESESEGELGGVPLYDSDSAEDEGEGLRDITPSPMQRRAEFVGQSSLSSAPPTSPSSVSPSPPISPVARSAGKYRAGSPLDPRRRPTLSTDKTIVEASASQAGPSSLGEAAASKDDPFYVSSSGVIHHSSDKAFEEVGNGSVHVVLGWEAATRRAQKVVRGEGSFRTAGTSGDIDH